MKNFACALFLTFLIAPGLPPVAAAEDDIDAELAAVRARVNAEFPNIAPGNVSRAQVDGWFLIRQGAIIAYVSGDGRYLMQGDLIDLQAQVNLTEQERNQGRRELMSKIGVDDTITFSPVDPKHTVTIFTDIDCGYCRRLHNQIDEYLSAGIEVRYLLYPRNGPMSPSWSKAEQVWCADDRNEALTLAKRDESFESRQCDSAMVTRHYGLGQDVGLRGTPAIVLEDGRLVSGYLPPDRLVARINSGR